MLYQLGHGKRIKVGTARGTGKGYAAQDAVGYEHVCNITKSRSASAKPYYPVPDPDPDPQPGLEPREVFRFLFKDAPESGEIADAAAKLDALADAMAEATSDQKDEAGESAMAPIMTYLGQFIDHDITANTDREESDAALDGFNIDKTTITPQPRDDVEKNKLNLRKGRLELDSVYGDGPGQTPEAEKLEAAMRDPGDPAKMRIGAVTPVSDGSAPFLRRPVMPTDAGADLPRIGQAIDDGTLTEADARAIFDEDGTMPLDVLRRIPMIGDGRNEENLIVAQTHLSFLRYHNAVVDALRADGGPTDDDELFAAARQQVTWTYQWLVINLFLKTVCDPAVVDAVVANKASVYQAFFDAHKDSVPEGARPMPLEFSVACYRYGHSMVRGDYDYNLSFGREPDGSGNRRAMFDQIFQFTAGGGMMGLPTLPDNWIIEWDRFTGAAPLPNRVARKIDTRMALPLKSMRNDMPGMSGIMAHLSARNLRRGYVFNLPCAQDLIAALGDMGDPMPADQVASGPTGDALRAGGFDTKTPLWFYTLKEAEVQHDGAHLGTLGSRIISETIVGLIVTDPNSFINQGTFNSWSPDDGVKPLGEAITSLDAWLRAGGLMAGVGA